jgi:methane monooxygenase component A beta chain
MPERRHVIVDPELMAEIRKDLPPRRLDHQRQLKFFVVPGGPRLTEYETLTMYAQQGTDWASGGFEVGDSMQKWPGGRPTYAPESTEVRTTDWWRFRDPEGRWFFPSVKNKSEEGRQNHRFMLAYSADGGLRLVDPHWLLDVLPTIHGAFLFHEYGLFNAHASVVHDCMSDIVRVFLANIAFDKSDAAQLIQTQRVFINKLAHAFPVALDAPKEAWLTSPLFHGARRVVEELWEDTFDHIEVVWAAHCIHDALFGQYMRREFFTRVASRFGDAATPWFMAQSIGFHQYAAQGMRALCFGALLSDPEFGDLNRRWLHVWTAKWLPKTLGALRDVLGMYRDIESVAGLTDTSGIEASVERVIDDWLTDYAIPMGYVTSRDVLIEHVLGTDMNGFQP